MTPPNVVMIAPSTAFGSTFTDHNGTSYTIGATGILTIPATSILDALNAGFAGPLNVQVVNAITAFATGGQTNATALTGVVNRVSVCATAADSVMLPVSSAGLSIVVENDGAAALAVFGQVGDFIGSGAVNIAHSVPSGASVVYRCTVAGTWQPDRTIVSRAKFTLNTASGASTAAAGDLTGAAFTVAEYTAIGAAALTTRTGAQMCADASLKVGDSWILRITNLGTAGTVTLTAAVSGVTLTGTMTIANNTFRDFVCTVTAANAITMQSMGVGTIS